MTRTTRFLILFSLAVMGCLLTTGAALAEDQAAQTSEDSTQSRVVVRTLPDGTVQVVQVGADGEDKAEPSQADDDDGLEALAAIAQRLRMADAAEQGLDASSQSGSKTRPSAGRPVMRPRTDADGRLGLQQRLRVQNAPQATGPTTAGSAGAAAPTTAQGVPCLAKGEVDPEVDPCEVAQRIGRLQPCRTPKECEAYDLWRQQYGAPGLRPAKPAERAAKPAAPSNREASDDDPRR